ncbi:RNA-binding domain-containing protein [Paenibacillus amylolyticus]|uniref:RNA-binding domain-containing protein n=1 Tax=Paenibacillus amylolyticus TaxID=1451 RepID=UPI00339A3E55
MEKLLEVSLDKLMELKSIQANTESATLDFKETFSLAKSSGIEIVKDIVSFANTKGGHIIFGVTKDYKWVGLDERSDERIDDANVYNLIDKYVEGQIDILIALHTIENREFVICYISPSQSFIPFKIDGKYMKTDRQKKQFEEVVFRKGDVYCRRGSRSIKADHIFYKQKSQNFETVHNLPAYSPFHRFIGRDSQVEQLHNLLNHENTRLLQVDGIGGIGKTSLVYHYCMLLSSQKIVHDFDFIVWMSGKRTYFTPAGERNIRNYIATYLDTVNEISTFFDADILFDNDATDQIINLLGQYNVLLVIDNLETLIEDELTELLFNLPRTNKAILTTRESISDFQMSKITLDGLTKEEFVEFIDFEYGRLKENKIVDKYGANIDELFTLTKGMPLAAQLVVNQLVYDAPIDFVLEGLKSGNTYETLLSFCFRGTVERISDVSKKVLYIISISDKEKLFTINDLKYISGSSEDELYIAIQELSKLTLCFSDRTSEGMVGYGSYHLMKLYIRQQDIPEKAAILKNYEQFNEELRLIEEANVSEEQYLLNTRARTHEERVSALNIKHILSSFYYNGYDFAIELLNSEMKKCSKFAFLHYMKAIIEKMSNLYNSYKLATSEFDTATKLDPELVDSWIDWGHLELDQKQYRTSSQYFKQALTLDAESPKANHGYARSLFYICRRDNDVTKAQLADEHYKKGFYRKSGGGSLTKQEMHSNAINAHSQALNLMINLNDLPGAMNAVTEGLTFEVSNHMLLSLKGEINKKLKSVEYTRLSNEVVQKNSLNDYPLKDNRLRNQNITESKDKVHNKSGYSKQAKVSDNLSEETILKLKQLFEG